MPARGQCAAPALVRERTESSSRPVFAERCLVFVAVALPFVFAVSRATASAQWRSDVAALRDHGLVSLSFGGSLTTVMTQGADLLPLGSLAFRGAMVSATALAVGCWFCFRIIRRVLSWSALRPELAALFAALGTLTAGLSGTWQHEATVAGGAMVAVALALAAIDQAVSIAGPRTASLTPQGARRWLLLSGLVVATLVENLPAGVAVAVAVAACVATEGRPPPRRLVPSMVAMLVFVGAPLAALPLLRRLAPRGWSDIGRVLSSTSLAPMKLDPGRTAALEAWVRQFGYVALSLAAIGLLVSVFRPRRRAAMAAVVALVLADLVYPMAAAPELGSDPLGALRVLALASLAMAAAFGLAELVAFLLRLTVPMARTASVLVVVFYMTIIAVTSEEAAFDSDRAELYAAEEWTDTCVVGLPVRSAVLVHSPEMGFRFWAARLLRGERPDTVVIAAPLLARGSAMPNLLPVEPEAAQLVRDFALTGKAEEYSLSALADRRPLYVELDREWDRKVVDHLAIDGAWLRYSPQVLGKSDRSMTSHVLVKGGRVSASIDTGMMRGDSTAVITTRTLKEHATTLSLIGMNKESGELLAGIEHLDGDDAFATSARLRLAHATRRRRGHRSLELRDLLKFSE